MKVFLCVILIYLINLTEGDNISTYTTKYDNVNIKEILANDRLLTGYVKCLLDQGPCTPDGKELKNNLPDAIANDCKKCSEKQRKGADEVMQYIIDYRPNDWNKLEKKYNSDGSYKRKYLKSKTANGKIDSRKGENISFTLDDLKRYKTY